MHYTLDYLQVSDESLFVQMTRGNKTAATILFNRYEHLGRQIAGTYIRTECLKGYTDESFIEAIHDAINKAFHYYQLNQTRFATFCRNILNQNIASQVKEIIDEITRQKEVVSLDDSSGPLDRDLHDVIGDSHQLSMSDYYDLNQFLDYVSEETDPELRTHSMVYILYNLDMTIKEIADKLHMSVYKVRKYIQETQDGLNGVTLRL